MTRWASALALSQAVEVNLPEWSCSTACQMRLEFTGPILLFQRCETAGSRARWHCGRRLPGFGAEAGFADRFQLGEIFNIHFFTSTSASTCCSGIPLRQSGLALKAALGKFGINVVPEKTRKQNW